MRAVYQEERLKPNYYALFLAIKKQISVSKACSLMGISSAKGTKSNNYGNKYDIKEDEILEMIELKKEGKSYQEIAKRFMVTKGTVFTKLKRHMGESWDNRPW